VPAWATSIRSGSGWRLNKENRIPAIVRDSQRKRKGWV
jgi:hypothetical protein